MPTDSLSIIYSAKRGTRFLVNNGIDDINNPLSGISSTTIIRALHSLLLEVGWEEKQCYKASGFVLNIFNVINVRSGVPIFPKNNRECNGPYFGFSGYHFVIYDPDTQNPAATNPSSCPGVTIYVPSGYTAVETLQNLAAAISANTPYNGTYVAHSGLEGHENSNGVFIEAKICGPEYNLSLLEFNPEINLVTVFQGGGYRMRSQPPASIYDVNIQGLGESVEQPDEFVGFTFLMPPPDLLPIGSVVSPGTTSVYKIPTPVYQFNPQSTILYMVANPHQFVIFDDTNDITNGVCIFACAPYIPAELGLLDYAAFVIGGGLGSLRNTNNWGPHTISAAINCPVIDFQAGGFAGRIRPLCLRSPTNPILTPSGKPLVETSYVIVESNHPSIHEGVFGQIYDCAHYHDYVPSGVAEKTVTVNGRKFLAIGGSDGSNQFTRTTFVMAYE